MKLLRLAPVVALAASLSVRHDISSNETAAAEIDLTLSKLPPVSTFIERITHSTQAALHDPCGAQMLSHIWYWGAGFGSKFNNLVNAVMIAAAHDPPLSFALCGVENDEYTFYKEMWASHFMNGLGLPVCKKCDTAHETASKQLYSILGPAGQLTNKFPDDVLAWKHQILNKVFMLNKETKEAVDRNLAPLGLGENYIGIHIRHGDKKTEARLLPSDAYAMLAKPYLEMLQTAADSDGSLSLMVNRTLEAVDKYNITKVYLASDDKGAEAGLIKALPGKVKVVQAPRLSSDKAYMHYNVGAKGSFEANVALLTDIWALWHSKVFIGTGSSNLGRLIYHLRGQKQDAISADALFMHAAGF